MFKKVIGLAALAGVSLMVTGIGCSVTTTNTTTDGGGTATDAPTTTATGTGTTPRPDGGGKDAAPAGCYDEQAALALTGTAPTKGAGKCTTAQITDLKAKCLGSGSAADCTAFLDANKDCGRCVLGALKGDDPKTTPIGALIPVSETSVSPNIGSCAALVIGKPECALKVAQEVTCLNSACDSCSDQASDTACQNQAATGVCKDVIDAACDKAITDAAAQWQPICRGTNFDDTYPKVAEFLCGAGGGGDAGGGG